MKALPVSADHVPESISPEGAQIANTYLQVGCDIEKVSELLDLPGHEINSVISSKPVQTYIIQVLTDVGLRSMDKISESMQEVIDVKLQEMRDLEMTSSKDIADLLQMMHKMQESKVKLLNAKQPKESISSQTNHSVNIFNADSESQYGRLIHALIEGNK